MKGLVVSALVLSVGLSVALALGPTCGDSLPGEPGPPVEEVFANIARALADGGEIAIVSEAPRDDDFLANRSVTTLRWLDVSTERARIETRITYPSIAKETHGVAIVAAGYWHYSSNGEPGTRPFETCEGVPGTMSLYSPCPELQAESRKFTTIARSEAEFDGRPAIVIITRGSYYGIDSKITFDRRLYIDGENYLPLARVTKTHDSDGDGYGSQHEVRFTHTFVDRDTLPADWFDPASASYEEIDLPLSPP